MAHVSNQPRCVRCKRFRATMPTRTSVGVEQMCLACASTVGWPSEGTPKVETVDCERCKGKCVIALGSGVAMCRDCDGKGKVTRAIKEDRNVNELRYP